MSFESSVIYSAAGVEIITQPFLVGKELEELALQSSTDFVRALPEDLGNVVSLEILNGGHYYFVAPAYEAVRGTVCPVSILRAKRKFENGEWKVNIWDEGGTPLIGFDTILIGDTVATGTTLAYTIRAMLVKIREAGAPPPNVMVFTIVGSISVKEHPVLQEIHTLLAENGKHLHLFYANARFKLDDANGTDLSFTGAEFDERAESEVATKLGEYRACMKCAVWDWGDRFREPQNHLEEIHEYYSSTDPKAPQWLMDGISSRMRKP